MKCSTDEEGVEPAVVAQKIYFWTVGKNLTESELINTVRGPKMSFLDGSRLELLVPLPANYTLKRPWIPASSSF